MTVEFLNSANKPLPLPQSVRDAAAARQDLPKPSEGLARQALPPPAGASRSDAVALEGWAKDACGAAFVHGHDLGLARDQHYSHAQVGQARLCVFETRGLRPRSSP